MKNYLLSAALLVGLMFMVSCGDDEGTTPPVGPMPTGESKSFDLSEFDGSGVSGTVKFSEIDDNSITIDIDLTGTAAGSIHPSHIHAGNAATGGDIVLDLTNVVDGKSTTNISKWNDGTAVTYAEILQYEGYINVHLSAADLATLVAQGNIGSAMNPVTVDYAVVNQTNQAYVFTGNGLTNVENPDLTLKKGMTYTFTIGAVGHPFNIKTVQGTGTENRYDNGVTGNGTETGVVTFVVPSDAPATLFYNCSQTGHDNMTGTITITE